MAFFLVADLLAKFFFERWKEVEGDVGGLEVFGFGVGDVVGERAVCAEAGRGRGGFAVREGCGVDAGEHARGDGFGIAFDAGELTGDHDVWMGLELEGFGEQRRCVDVGVAVNLAVAEEGRVSRPGMSFRTRFCSPNFKWFWKPTRL